MEWESIGGSDEADAVQDLAEVRKARVAATLLQHFAAFCALLRVFWKYFFVASRKSTVPGGVICGW